jgi:hypothetical protein
MSRFGHRDTFSSMPIACFCFVKSCHVFAELWHILLLCIFFSFSVFRGVPKLLNHVNGYPSTGTSTKPDSRTACLKPLINQFERRFRSLFSLASMISLKSPRMHHGPINWLESWRRKSHARLYVPPQGTHSIRWVSISHEHHQ